MGSHIMRSLDFTEYNRRSKLLWAVICSGGAIAAGLSLWQLTTLAPMQIWQFMCLLLLIGVLSRMAVAMPNQSGVLAPTDALIFLAVYFLGPAAATIGAAFNGLIAARQTARQQVEQIYHAASQAVSTWMAALLMGWVIGQNPLSSQPYPSAATAPVELFLSAAVAMVAVYFACHATLTVWFQAWKQQRHSCAFWRTHYLWSAVHVFIAGFSTAFVFILTERYSPLYLLAIAPLLAASFAACRNYFAKVEAASHDLAEINRLHFATVEALATAIDAKDQVTHEHVRRVQIYAEGLGRMFNLPEAEIEALRAGDVARAIDLMNHHLESVTMRALLTPRAERDVRVLLASYAQSEGLGPQ